MLTDAIETPEQSRTPPEIEPESRISVGRLRAVRLEELLTRTRRGRRRGAVVYRALLCSDLLALSIGVGVGWLTGLGSSFPNAEGLVLPLVLVLGGLGFAHGYGLYEHDERHADHTTASELPGILHVSLALTLLALLVAALSMGNVPAGPMLAMFASTGTLLLIGRAITRAIVSRLPGYRQNAVIIGSGSIGQTLARKLMTRRTYGLDVIGFVDDDPAELGDDVANIPVIGRVEELNVLLHRFNVDRVIVAFSFHSHERMLQLVRSLHETEVQIDVVPRLFDVFGPRAAIHSIDGIPLIGHPRTSRSRTSLAFKRCVDALVALVGIVALLPALALLWLLVRLDSRGPGLYRAERVGRGGRAFTQLKFRTMKREFCQGERYGADDADARFEEILAASPAMRAQFHWNQKLDPDPRVTRVGRLLRATSLDELPQLFNILRGDLSLVGPRPVTRLELLRYGERAPELLSVRPGLTGYWQISGRSALSYDERIRLDLAYVRRWSLKLDFLILLKSSSVLTARAGGV